MGVKRHRHDETHKSNEMLGKVAIHKERRYCFRIYKGSTALNMRG